MYWRNQRIVFTHKRGAGIGRQIVSYLRILTGKQGRSGLGIEAQREAITRSWLMLRALPRMDAARRSHVRRRSHRGRRRSARPPQRARTRAKWRFGTAAAPARERRPRPYRAGRRWPVAPASTIARAGRAERRPPAP